MDWDPTQFFRTDAHNPPSPYALLVLNQPINEKAFKVLREHGTPPVPLQHYLCNIKHKHADKKEKANYTICADGGANRFYDLMRKNGLESTIVTHPSSSCINE